MTETMKAWQYSTMNGKLEDCISLKDIPKPTQSSLSTGQILVQIISASLNPVDYKLPESGMLGRMMISRPATPGLDFCGRVIAKHPSSSAFEEGQLVFGGFASSKGPGTLSQYTVIPEAFCAALPAGIDPDDASAVGTAATTAYQSLMPETLKPGAKVLINGGSGGVGTWGIQFAKAMGVEVVTTCSTENVELCRQLGADEVLDYKKVDIFSSLKEKAFDLVIDNVGRSDELYNNSRRLLKPTGTFVQVGVPDIMTMSNIGSIMKRQMWPSAFGGGNFYFVNMKNSTELFSQIGHWMKEGKANAVIDTTYKWEEVPLAFGKLRGGHLKGKIVIHVANDSS
ncbi:uncharacterized protein AUP68_10015 [Ilyonectria robusta]